MSMQRQPILLGLLIVGAALSLLLLIFRLFGLPRGEAVYLAGLTVAVLLYFVGQRWQQRS
jgi:hypothetical protein